MHIATFDLIDICFQTTKLLMDNVILLRLIERLIIINFQWTCCSGINEFTDFRININLIYLDIPRFTYYHVNAHVYNLIAVECRQSKQNQQSLLTLLLFYQFWGFHRFFSCLWVCQTFTLTHFILNWTHLNVAT